MSALRPDLYQPVPRADGIIAVAGIAKRLRRATGLKTTNWTKEISQRFEDLNAQTSTGTAIKAFSLIAIVRHEAEIGIMQAMGADHASAPQWPVCS